MFDAVLADAGIQVVLSGIQMPRMNSIMERWVQTCRRELLDRSLIWNQRHLLHALREFEQFYNGHRPHQGIANARPLYPLPAQVADPDKIARRTSGTEEDPNGEVLGEARVERELSYGQPAVGVGATGAGRRQPDRSSGEGFGLRRRRIPPARHRARSGVPGVGIPLLGWRYPG
jgi:hypothetical protein